MYQHLQIPLLKCVNVTSIINREHLLGIKLSSPINIINRQVLLNTKYFYKLRTILKGLQNVKMYVISSKCLKKSS